MRVTQRKKLTLWRPPRFKAFTPTGVTLGATVTDGLRTGQVWSKAPWPRSWWVVLDNQQYVSMTEPHMVVLGQCVTQDSLTEAA